MISIRKKIEESEQGVLRFQALLKAFLGLTTALPKTALPANPELSAQCKEDLDRATAPCKEDAPPKVIEEAGSVALRQIEHICSSNKAALDERDAALRDVVDTAAAAISGLRGHGVRHESNLHKLADGFDALSRVADVDQLRRRLREDVAKLRQAAEEMRRDSEESISQFETQISVFEQRLESARKESGIDRLTGLGSRREAERQMRRIPRFDGPVCVLLFDIEGFREINKRHGTPFGDKVLQALAHTLRDRFPGEGSLFRWGADEFLVIAEGSLAARMEQCRGICEFFAGSRYFSLESGQKIPVSAPVAGGAAQYVRGETVEDLYRRSRESLEQHRRSLRK